MPNNSASGALLFLHAHTSLHPGSGHALGTIDLPVQRERHTHWPIIQGSSIKGVLRDACRQSVGSNNDPDLSTVFGPPTEDAHKHAGAFVTTDARILLFPVRSMKGVFAWTTCPTALARLKSDAQLANLQVNWDVPTISESTAANNKLFCKTIANSPLLINSSAILEEYEFTRDGDLPPALPEWLATNLNTPRMKTHLIVLNDNEFSHFVRYACEVSARIGLDPTTKTVKDGALFYQEFLPAETVMYSIALAQGVRAKSSQLKDPAAVLEWVRSKVKSVLQIGGDETIGKGICTAKFVHAN